MPPSQPTATSTKPKKKKTATVQRIDTSDSRVFPFIHEDVFDTNRFVKTDETVYTSAEMKKYDGDFQKQLNFNFSQCIDLALELQKITILQSGSASRWLAAAVNPTLTKSALFITTCSILIFV
jgi:hypothetical protein